MKICTTTFVVGRHATLEGTVVSDDDPRVASSPDHFQDIELHMESRVESASAKPGEKRSVKKAAAKKTAATESQD